MKKLSFALILGLFLTLLTTDFVLATTKIGYIDMQKAIQATKEGKSAKTSLEKEFKKRKKELEKKEADLKKLNNDLKKKAMVLSDDVRLKKQQNLQEEMVKYRDLVAKNQLEIQKKERELTLPIIKKMRKIIDEIAKKDGFTMILEKSEQSVLWAKKELDVTDTVVKRYNKK